MRRLTTLFGGGRSAALSPAMQQRLRRWRRLTEPDFRRRHGETRYVVVDVELTGPDLRRDTLIAIGALAVVEGCIAPADAFAVTLRQEMASNAGNILIHGIGAGAQHAGTEPAEALLAFLEYVGKAPLIAYHAFLDKAMIERAISTNLGFSWRGPWIDLAWVLPELFSEKIDRKATLDEWLAVFAIETIQRHNALSDAFATAKLLQIALRHAALAGAWTAQQLEELELHRRRRFGWLTSPAMPSEKRPGQ